MSEKFSYDDLVNGTSGAALSNLTNTAYSQPWQTVQENFSLTSFRVSAGFSATTPSSGTFTANASFDLFTKTGHGFQTGLLVQVSNSGGALPSGLSAATNYYVIRIDADTFKLATSYALAAAGTPINITTNGTGTQTVTPTTLSASVSVQFSNDFNSVPANATWFTEPNSSRTLSGSGSFVIDVDYARAASWRLVITIASGQVSLTTPQVLYKGEG